MSVFDNIWGIKLDYRRPACIETPAPIFEPTMQYDSLERARQELRGLHRELMIRYLDGLVLGSPDVDVLVDISVCDLVTFADQCGSALGLLEEI